MLGYYNGRKWGGDVKMNIREGKKDIFLTFDNGKVTIMEGTKVVTNRTHATNTFRCSHLFLGSTFRASERLIGDIDHFAIYDRVLSSDEISDILKNNSQNLNKTNPVEYFDFVKGNF